MLTLELTNSVNRVAMETIKSSTELSETATTIDEKSSNKDRYFKGQQESEELVCFFRKHWITLLLPIAYFLIAINFWGLIMFGLISSNFFSDNIFLYRAIFFAMFAGLTLYLHQFFLKMVAYFLHVTLITNQRIVEISKSIYLKHSLEAIDLTQIQDLNKIQNGLVKNLLKFGELSITLSSTASNKTLFSVPKADFHFRVINRAIRAAKQGISLRTHFGLGDRAKDPEAHQQALKDFIKE